MDIAVIKARILRACRAAQAAGNKIAVAPVIDGEVCPMQAVCIEKVGGWGLMWYPWYRGPMHELGLTREQVWNFIAGFDGKDLSAYEYTSKTFEDTEFYYLGQEMALELEIR